jgi:hypothetical protein
MKNTLKSSHKLQIWLTIAAGLFIIGIATLVWGITVRANAVNARLAAQHHVDHEICVRVNNINKVIIKQLQRSEVNTPKLSYYKQHPDELKLILAEIRHEKMAFRPRSC